jgi:hypothetical protein
MSGTSLGDKEWSLAKISEEAVIIREYRSMTEDAAGQMQLSGEERELRYSFSILGSLSLENNVTRSLATG